MKIVEWIDRFYKPDRLNAEAGRRERIIADRQKDFSENKIALIGRHDSVTGKIEIYRGPDKHYSW